MLKERLEKIIATLDSIKMSPNDFFKMVDTMVNSLGLDLEQMEMFFDVDNVQMMDSLMNEGT